MKRIFLSVFAVAMLLFAGSQVQAFDGYRGGGHGHHGGGHGHHGGNHGGYYGGHGGHNHYQRSYYPSYNYNRGYYGGGYNYYQPRPYYPYRSGFSVRTPGFGLYIGR